MESNDVDLSSLLQENERLSMELAKVREDLACAKAAQAESESAAALLSKRLTTNSDLSDLSAERQVTFIEKVFNEDPVFQKLGKLWKALPVLYTWFMKLKEPERSGKFETLITGAHFSRICGVLIFSYTCVIIISTNYLIEHKTDVLPKSLLITEYMFLCAFSIEIALKLAVHKLYYFVNQDAGWNIFDLVIVVVSIVGEVGMGQGDHGGLDPSSLRVIRLCKAVKALQAFRLMQVINGLRQMIECTVRSFAVLWACIATLCIFIFIFSVIFVQGAAVHLKDDRPDEEEDFLVSNFGGIARSMVTLFMTIAGGMEWSDMYHTFKRIGVEYSWVVLFFEAFAQIALLNIITAQFVESSVHILKGDREDALLAQRHDQAKKAKELMEAIYKFHKDENKNITEQEFVEEMDKPESKLHKTLEQLGLETMDVHSFFHALLLTHKHHGQGSDKNPGVNLSDFVHGCLKLEGSATSFDMQVVLTKLKTIRREIHQLHHEVHGHGPPGEEVSASFSCGNIAI